MPSGPAGNLLWTVAGVGAAEEDDGVTVATVVPYREVILLGSYVRGHEWSGAVPARPCGRVGRAGAVDRKEIMHP